MISIFAYLIFCFWNLQSLGATPVIQQQGRLELDWGALKLRFEGVYTFKPNPKRQRGQRDSIHSIPWKMAQDKASQEGLLVAQQAVKDLNYYYYAEILGSYVGVEAEKRAHNAGSLVARSTYIYNTIYYQSGGVEVEMENSLTKVFRRHDISFRQDQSPIGELGEVNKKQSLFTSVWIALDKEVLPVADYELVDESGVVLFTIEAMTREGYERNLMGRWFYESRQTGHKKHSGSNSLFINAKVKNNRTYIVTQSDWSKLSSDGIDLLRQGKVLLVLPKYN